MRILVTGANGQLGRALVRALDGHDVSPLDHTTLDITDHESVLSTVSELKPDAIVNAAAWTDTVGCESDPERARLANGFAPGYLAEGCRDAGAIIVHISSNEVFDGTKGEPYTEEDPVNPINQYGRSKLLGEEEVRANCDQHQVVRTSWLYGPGRISFPEKILDRAKADGRLTLVTDEIASPTWTVDLAEGVAKLLQTGATGTFHLANGGSCSRRDWAAEILRLRGLDVPITETTQAAFDLPFAKPVDSTLANVRAAALGVTMREWREALADHLNVTAAAKS
jgi:dTDP-4-dehydrorhamnose reductase